MKISNILFLLMFSFATIDMVAQPLPPSGQPTPIGGVALLAAAGVAYGSKKVMDMKKKQD